MIGKYNSQREGELDTPWDKHYKIVLIRNSPIVGAAPHILEFGVNYFVNKLESIGFKTQWSCEGHPHGFYVVFSAPVDLAFKIAVVSNNFADVRITRGVKRWDIKNNEIVYYKQPWWVIKFTTDADSYEQRNYLLRELSIEWEKHL